MIVKLRFQWKTSDKEMPEELKKTRGFLRTLSASLNLDNELCEMMMMMTTMEVIEWK